MIFSIIIKLITMLLQFFSYFIPNWFLPETLENSFVDFIEHSIQLNDLFPVADIMFCIGLILFFHLSVFTFNIVSKIVSLIRGGGDMTI